MGNKKKCNTCKEFKSIRCFYKQKNGLLGRTGSCKQCRLEYQSKYQKENSEKRRLSGKKWRYNNPDKQRERCERFKQNNPEYWREYYKQNKEKRLAANKRWLENNPERKTFYNVYRNALRNKIIVRPEQCNICGNTGNIQGHHYDYTDPLKVTWVCRECHHYIHKKNRFTKKRVEAPSSTIVENHESQDTKRCRKCKIVKGLDEFYKQAAGLLGRTGSCKKCRLKDHAEYYQRHKEERRAYARRYKEENPQSVEKKREQNRQYREKNPNYWTEYRKKRKEQAKAEA